MSIARKTACSQHKSALRLEKQQQHAKTRRVGKWSRDERVGSSEYRESFHKYPFSSKSENARRPYRNVTLGSDFKLTRGRVSGKQGRAERTMVDNAYRRTE